MKLTKSKQLILGLIIVLPLAACNDNSLKAVATNIDRVATVINDAREVRDELLAQGVIDRDDAYKTTLALYRVNGAFKTFNAKAKTYASAGELTPEGKADLTKLATDIADMASELISSGAVGVKNPEAQNKINAAVSAIKQVTLVLVETIKALKTKPAAQQAGIDPMSATSMILLLLRQLMATVAAERARSGKTVAEIFDAAGHKLEENELNLLNDLVALAPAGEVPPEVQAKLDAAMAELTK